MSKGISKKTIEKLKVYLAKQNNDTTNIKANNIPAANTSTKPLSN